MQTFAGYDDSFETMSFLSENYAYDPKQNSSEKKQRDNYYQFWRFKF